MVRQRERIKIHRPESLTGRMSYRSEWRASRAFRDWFLNLGLLLALKRANKLLFLSHRFDCCSGEPASLEITTQQFRLSSPLTCRTGHRTFGRGQLSEVTNEDCRVQQLIDQADSNLSRRPPKFVGFVTRQDELIQMSGLHLRLPK